MTITVRRVGMEALEPIVPLFDAYRVFYRQESDLEGARAFLRARLAANEATVFAAYLGGEEEPAGFAKKYKGSPRRN